MRFTHDSLQKTDPLVRVGKRIDPCSTLLRRYSEGELHHGVIFHGEPIESVENRALDLCRFILGIENDRREHPDLFHLRPAGKMRIISVDRTRELISELYRTSNQGGAKIALIYESDRMRKEAANAF